MSVLITGAAGFVGSNLAEALIQRGYTVFGIDNLSRGRLSNLMNLIDNPCFSFCKIEMTNLFEFRKGFAALHTKEPITEVWHLAANSDIPAGVKDATVDLHDTFMTTFNTIEIMKSFGIKIIAFASSSAIYGNFPDRQITEDIGPLLPISNYGAMKLSSEAIISAAVESHLQRAYFFRFPNVIGVPATHGVILDFIQKLKITPYNLEVLGNGTQKKVYLHIEELVDAMLFIREHAEEKINVYNIGSDDNGASVRFIAEETVKVISPGATISYGEDNKGWVGDVPHFTYSIEKLKKLGWKPILGSKEAVQKAIIQIVNQKAVD